METANRESGKKNISESPADPFIMRQERRARERERENCQCGRKEKAKGHGERRRRRRDWDEERAGEGDSEEERARLRNERRANEWAGGEDEGFSRTISGTQVRGSKQGGWL